MNCRPDSPLCVNGINITHWDLPSLWDVWRHAKKESMVNLKGWTPSVPTRNPGVDMSNMFEAILIPTRDRKSAHVFSLALGLEYNLICYVSDACKEADLHRLHSLRHNCDIRSPILDYEKAYWQTLHDRSQSLAIGDGYSEVVLHSIRVQIFVGVYQTSDGYMKYLNCRWS